MRYLRCYHEYRGIVRPSGAYFWGRFSTPSPGGRASKAPGLVSVSEKTFPCSEAVVRLLLRLFHKKPTRLWPWSSACRRATLLFGLSVVASPRHRLA
jgi:hypothetical protein